MPKYLFFDINPKIITGYNRHLANLANVECIVEDVLVLGQKRRIDVLVSPANSYGYMDGGIDQIYSDMFDDIEGIVQKVISQIGYPDGPSGKITTEVTMPVGSAFIVPIRHLPNHPVVAKWMICAPTMKWPRDIRKAQSNIYFCMLAILHLCQNMPNDIVVAIPGLGTFCGYLSGEESGVQIAQAFQDFINGIDQSKYPKNVTVEQLLTEKTNAPFAYLAYPPFLK